MAGKRQQQAWEDMKAGPKGKEMPECHYGVCPLSGRNGRNHGGLHMTCQNFITPFKLLHTSKICIDPTFKASRLSLLDRGFIFAIAHIRGGGEMGRQWYENGKFLNKKNTFTDFITCAEYLLEHKYSSKEKLCIEGRSAGGLLIGSVLNLRPDLFKAAVAGVPFVDVLTTMLDPTIPLTTEEWEKKQLPRNWKVPEQSEFRDLFLLSEVLLLRKPCKASFSASAGEIFLPITWRALGESEKESMFVSRRIMSVQGSNVVEDFTCIGCQSCGSPLDLDNGSIFKQISASYFCPKTSDHLHIAGLIYRPFMLYVWDESEYVPLLVRNKAAEILFGNLKAERVYSSYKEQKHAQNCKQKDIGKQHHRKNINFHMIWLVLVKMMLQQGKNSPLRFEVAVNPSLDIENGKFEMVSMSIPCIRTKCSSC